MTASHRLDELRQKIRTADDQYYNRGYSDLTDTEYDILFVELRKLEAEHPALVTADSPTHRVGAPLAKGGTFPTVAHLAPMGSIESLMASDEVRDFDARVQKLLGLPVETPLAWSCEPKLDGTSANLLYEQRWWWRWMPPVTARSPATTSCSISGDSAVGGAIARRHYWPSSRTAASGSNWAAAKNRRQSHKATSRLCSARKATQRTAGSWSTMP